MCVVTRGIMALAAAKGIAIVVTFLGSLVGILIPNIVLSCRERRGKIRLDNDITDITELGSITTEDSSPVKSLPASHSRRHSMAAIKSIMIEENVDSKTFEQDWFFALRCIGSGSILSVGLLHTFAEGTVVLGDLIEFPLGNALCLCGALSVLFVEHFVVSKDDDNGHNHLQAGSDRHLKNIQQLQSKAIVLDMSAAVHSFIVGLSLGIDTDRTNVQVLTAAFFFHQLFEGIPIGVSLVAAKFSPCVQRALGTLFVVTTSIGIAIGMGVQSTFKEGSATNMWISGCLNSFVSGNLVNSTRLLYPFHALMFACYRSSFLWSKCSQKTFIILQ